MRQEIMLSPTLTNFTEVAKKHSEDKKKIGMLTRGCRLRSILC